MAITYVGGASNVGTGSTITVDLTSLTGGVASSPSEGDLVVVVWGHGDTTDRTMSVSTSGYDTPLDLYQTETWDPNLGVASKFMGSTPDTSVVVNRTSNAAYGGAAVVHVWRGVDTTTRYDVTRTTASGQNSHLVNPPSITPTTAGAVVLACGIGTQATTGAAFTIPSNMENGVSVKSDGTTSDAAVFIASAAWTSGAFDPNAVTGGTGGGSAGWIGVTIALRPAPPPPIELAASVSGSATVSTSLHTAGLYYVIYPSAEPAPSAAQIKAGQNSSGTAASASGAEPSRTTTGEQIFVSAASGLSASTSYKVSFVWHDGGAFSNVATSDAFSTAAPPAEFVAAVSGAGTTSAGLSTTIQMAASPAAAGSATGALATAIQLAAGVSGAGTTTANLQRGDRLSAAVAGEGTATAALSVATQFAASPASSSGTSAALTTQIQFAAAASGAASTSASLSAATQFAGSGAGSGSASGQITTAIQLAGAASASGTTAGALLAGTTLDASVSGAATASGTLQIGMLLSGSASGQGSAAGVLQRGDLLVAALASTSGASAALTTQIALAGAATGSGAAGASLQVGSTMAGAAAGAASASAQLRVGAGLSGSASVDGSVSAGITTAIHLAADVQGAGGATGSVQTAIHLSGAASGTAAASADLSTGGDMSAAAAASSSASAGLTIDRTRARVTWAVLTIRNLEPNLQAATFPTYSWAAGSLTTQIRLAGGAVAGSAASLRTTGPLGSAAASGAASASASLSVGARMSGAAAAASSAGGALTTGKPLSGAVSASSSASGALQQLTTLIGNATAAANSVAQLLAAVRFAGAATGRLTVTRALITDQAGSTIVIRVPAENFTFWVPPERSRRWSVSPDRVTYRISRSRTVVDVTE